MKSRLLHKIADGLRHLFFLVVGYISVPAMLFIAAICLQCLMSSCSTCERLARRCPPIEYVRDSIHVIDTLWFETLVIDTLMPVKLPPEYIYIVRLHTDTARGETAFTCGVAWCDGESLNLELTNKDSAEVLVQRIKTLERQVQYWKKIREHVTVKPEYRTRGIVKFFAWIGLIAFIYVLVRVLLFVLRKR